MKTELKPITPFTIDFTKNKIYCEVCGKSLPLPEGCNHNKKEKNHWDFFTNEHKACKEIWKKR